MSDFISSQVALSLFMGLVPGSGTQEISVDHLTAVISFCHRMAAVIMVVHYCNGEEMNKWVLEEIGSVLMLRKSMSERKMRFFGHIVRKNGMEKRLMEGKMEGKRRKGQTSNDLFPGFERMDQAGHCWCNTTGDRSGKMAKNHQSHSSAVSAT